MNTVLHGTRLKWPLLVGSVSIVGCAIPAAADVYLTESQALQVIFGADALATRELRTLTDGQRKKLESESGLRFNESSYSFIVLEKQGKLVGYALVLDEIGKSEPITFMVGMSPEGRVIDVAVMAFRESRGWEVKEKRFLRQFHNKRASDPVQIDRDIINYSGATLSSNAITRGVKKALHLFQEFYTSAERKAGTIRGDFRLPVRPVRLAPLRETRRCALYRQARYRMGTICEVRLWAESGDNADAAFSAAFKEVDRLDRMFSYYRDDSELARVNAGAAESYIEVSPEFFYLTHFALKWWKRSRFTFDVTLGPLTKAWGFHEGAPCIPSTRDLGEARARVGSEHLHLIRARQTVGFRKPGMELDFGGLAKGYAAQRSARLASKAGAVAVLVNLGGSSIHCAGSENASVSGRPDSLGGPDEPNGLRIGEWPVVIGGLGEEQTDCRCLNVASGWSLSASSSSEQSFQGPCGIKLGHIIDPRTGTPVEGLCAATVLTRSGTRSEVLTKPLLLLNDSFRTDFIERHGKPQWALVQTIRGEKSEIWEGSRQINPG